ncbi:MAG TPA: hypothetical protein VEL74_11655 [Thermoanaerobaculia bacterium]|nr:hypothetical protein [Thermoanaerobaculia bacterium]
MTSQRPGLPPEIEPVMARLLARDRAARYQRADEAARDLLALQVDLPVHPADRPVDRPEEDGTAAPTLVLEPGWRPAVKRAIEVHPRVSDVFVGRQEELTALRQALLTEPAEGLPATVCAIQGMPGVGKSYLADRFAVDHMDRFPGGCLRLVVDPKAPAAPRAMLDELAARLELAGGDGVAARVRERLLQPRTLLHIENVDSPAAEVEAGRLLRELPGCAVLVTGRLHDLGFAMGWRQVRMTAFDEETALLQLRGELGWTPSPEDEAGYRELVRSLGHLPLAVHLAAGHLRSGRSATGFLRMLRQRRLAITPADRTELAVGIAGEARNVLATSFSISLEILREEIGPEAGRLLAGLHALGHAPLTGFGRGLGAALAGLPDDDFEELVFHAQKLCQLLPIPRQERPDGAWRLHPLLAELLAAEASGEAAMDRMTRWFAARLPLGAPGEEAEQGRRWREVRAESAALAWWLPRVPAGDRWTVQQAGTWYARFNGPFHAWSEFCEEMLQNFDDPRQRGEILWTLGQVSLRQGRLDRAMEAAEEKLWLDRRRGDRFEEATAWELLADVLQARGELDDALATFQERQLPILEELGDSRSRAICLAKVGYLLKLRGCFGQALEVLREAQSALEEAGDVRSRAVALGFIADTLEAQGDRDESLRIRQLEELPIYQVLGELRATAVTMGKIAGILHARGEHETALAIRQEQEKPIYESLGDARQLSLCLGRIADIRRGLGEIDEAIRVRQAEQLPLLERLGSGYDLLFAREGLALLLLERRQPGDLEQAAALLRQALDAAGRLRLPEADRIRALLDEHGLVTRTVYC